MRAARSPTASLFRTPPQRARVVGGRSRSPATSGARFRAFLLSAVREGEAEPSVIYSERADGYSANAVAVWFHARFAELAIAGASSHSGRRTFITAAAKKITEAGGSLRDVQELAGHASLATT